MKGLITMLIIYHANCSDGFCAAWLLWREFPTARFVPCQYGDPFPEHDDEELVIIADFSFPDMSVCKGEWICFDHHKTANRASVTTFDLNKCGARLVAEWINVDEQIIDYIEDRDLWRHQLEGTHEVNAAIRSYPMDFDVWSGFDVEKLKEEGAAIQRYRQQLIDQHVARKTLVQFAGHDVYAVRCTVGDIISDIGGDLAGEGLFGVVESEKAYSLRSRGEFDVALLAKSLGGGGHKNAAGVPKDANPGVYQPVSSPDVEEKSGGVLS